MNKWILLISTSILSACAHEPKCGNPDGAKIILVDDKSCAVRIRQVTIGSEMSLPQSLKNSGLTYFQLEWIETSLNDGRISLGHFELVPISSQRVETTR